MSRHLSLEELKRLFPIQDLWKRAGYPEPRKWNECSNPWREDKKPSFSVHEDGMLFNDFSEGGGDNVRFWAITRGISDAEAIKELRAMAGGHSYHFTPPAPRSAPVKPQEPKKIIAPRGISYTDQRARDYVKSRRITPLVIDALFELEKFTDRYAFTSLRQGTHLGQPSLICIERWQKEGDVFSNSVTNTACRRIDNRPYDTGSSSVKELCLSGSTRNLPLGHSHLETLPEAPIMLCEGTPDFLAAWHIMLKQKREGEPCPALPLAMLGASNSIHPDALENLRNRRVRLYPHIDQRQQGATAMQKWGEALYQLGCQIDIFDFTAYTQQDGQPVTDLNDLLFTDTETKKKLTNILPI